jgi:type VI secretion system protein ImpG
MSFNRYFVDELAALRHLATEYAKENPALAPFLGTVGRDPDVERIFEGFAFLTGRLWQKLDDELPEITHGLFNLLWPNFLRPIPSCSVIKYIATANTAVGSLIKKGTLVESIPVNNTRCRFRTIYDVNVHPMELTGISFSTERGRAVMRLKISLLASSPKNFTIDSLPLFLSGEHALIHTLYFYLVQKVLSVSVLVTDNTAKAHCIAELSPESIRPMGFSDNEVLFPYPQNAFPGFRLLQEYFCFPEKFHFINISGLQKVFNKKSMSGLENLRNEFYLQFVMTDFPPGFESYTKNNVNLFCTPVVNLFPKSATPLSFDHKQNEYRIVPDPTNPYGFSTYSVEKVQSWSGASEGAREYKPFESFEHVAYGEQNPSYYRLRIKPAVKDQTIETWISIVHQNAMSEEFKTVETLSLELICTNRLLPTQLGVGDIRLVAGKECKAVDFKNITPVTPPYMPPLEGDSLWRLLSNMSLNYIPLTNIHALRSILTTYDFRALNDSRRAKILEQTLQGMISISMEETDRIYHGLPLRGARTTLVLKEKHFSCEGDMYLFASVVNEFLALYATVNSFHQLVVQEDMAGTVYEWPARLGAGDL